jgi:hypothetical protein
MKGDNRMKESHMSWQDQSPLSEAQDSVEKAERALNEAESHPSSQMVDQAVHAVTKAARAVADSHLDANTKAQSETELKLSELQSRLGNLRLASTDDTLPT